MIGCHAKPPSIPFGMTSLLENFQLTSGGPSPRTALFRFAILQTPCRDSHHCEILLAPPKISRCLEVCNETDQLRTAGSSVREPLLGASRVTRVRALGRSSRDSRS